MPVLAIWRYPVKAMLGERLDAVTIGPGGCEGDRRFAVIDAASGRRIANKRGPTDPRLRACRASLADGELRVTLPDGAVAAGGEVADALSGLLGRRVRLERGASARRPSRSRAHPPHHDGHAGRAARVRTRARLGPAPVPAEPPAGRRGRRGGAARRSSARPDGARADGRAAHAAVRRSHARAGRVARRPFAAAGDRPPAAGRPRARGASGLRGVVCGCDSGRAGGSWLAAQAHPRCGFAGRGDPGELGADLWWLRQAEGNGFAG